ncbi:hypothetical protein CLPU_2c02630 [Gottschalkia purinilytica]|uniref:Uncharacterized protein n=1 Tax=Gottschalkia purinilytica TaxID=1503 RepID=A0A0L0WEE7_GOTPU|nr:hypothetical protein [Gottschalkia purinilytica]KNF09811.1 hypothetical protein CLPU_2c02630 [Gottschalkia purinilytica]
MQSKKSYQRKFIILDKQDAQNAKGHAKLEIRDGKGRINLNVEGLDTKLKDDEVYEALIMTDKKYNFKKTSMGLLNVNKSGRGTLEFEFDSYSVGNTEINIENFNTILIRLSSEKENRYTVPLLGYINKKDNDIKGIMSSLNEDILSQKLREQNEDYTSEKITKEVKEDEDIEDKSKSLDSYNQEEKIKTFSQDKDINDLLDVNIESYSLNEEHEDTDVTEDTEVESETDVSNSEYTEEIYDKEDKEENYNSENYYTEGINIENVEDVYEEDIINDIDDTNDTESEITKLEEIDSNEDVEEYYVELYEDYYDDDYYDDDDYDYDYDDDDDYDYDDYFDSEYNTKDHDSYLENEIEEEYDLEQTDSEQETILDEDYYVEDEHKPFRYNEYYDHIQSKGKKEDSIYNLNGSKNHYFHNVENYSKQIASYTLNILKFFKEVKPFKQNFENYTWWEIDYDKRNIYRGFLPYYNYLVSMYYPYRCVTKYTTCQVQIKKYNHYIFGMIEENESIQYYAYGVPGKFTKVDQPYGGATGFVTWIEKSGSNEERLGYWIVYIDALTGKIVTPLNPTIPKE